jgi:aspartate/methionine/tyrosine aminotransferase
VRNFQLEVFFSTWEFKAKYHMTASDVESMSIKQILSMATNQQRADFESLSLSYTETWGAADLRQAIADTYDSLAYTNILCFAGAEEGIYTAMRVLLKKEDHAIVVVPNYQAAETLPLEICEVTGVALHADDDWQIDIDEVEKSIQSNTKLISINAPNNPTGATIRPERLEALIALCRKHDIYLFSDEVYHLLELDKSKRMPQIADVYEKGLSLNVMSKAYGLPGLRIGWIATQDKNLLLELERYKHYLSICNSAPSERLAVIALNNRDTILKKNRNLVCNNLKELEEFFNDYKHLFDWSTPDGGCIAYPRYIGRGGVESFCQSLVEEYGVLLLPASIYHSELMDAPTDRFRIGFGRKNIKEGLSQFRLFLDAKRAEFTP